MTVFDSSDAAVLWRLAGAGRAEVRTRGAAREEEEERRVREAAVRRRRRWRRRPT